MSLYLIGLRGVGKSTAGAAAARALGAPFADADAEVERVAGASIAEIFASRGEAAFRALERQVMLELLQRHDAVVASGGGCVLDPEVRRELGLRQGVIWLRAPAHELARRVRGSGRPADGPNRSETIARRTRYTHTVTGSASERMHGADRRKPVGPV